MGFSQAWRYISECEDSQPHSPSKPALQQLLPVVKQEETWVGTDGQTNQSGGKETPTWWTHGLRGQWAFSQMTKVIALWTLDLKGPQRPFNFLLCLMKVVLSCSSFYFLNVVITIMLHFLRQNLTYPGCPWTPYKLRVTLNSWFSCFCLPSAVSAGMYHHAHLKHLIYLFIKFIIMIVFAKTRSHVSHTVLEVDMKPRMILSPDLPTPTFQAQEL